MKNKLTPQSKKTLLAIVILISLLCVNLVSVAEGDYIDSFDTSGQTTFTHGVTTDGNNIWVVSSTDAEVYKYTMAGVYVDSFDISGQSSNAYGITTNETNIWVLDSGDREVYNYLADGTYRNSFDTSIYGADSYGIATDNVNMYLLDTAGKEVYKLTMTGGSVSNFDISAHSTATSEITTNGSYIWTIDVADKEVYKWTMAGVYVSSFDTSAHGADNIGIATNTTNIWVMDRADKEVYRYLGEAEEIIEVDINLITPENETALSEVGTNFTANHTLSISYLNWTNTTYYIWNSTGIFNNSIFIEIAGTENLTNEYIDEFILGNYEWNVLACWGNASFSNCSFADSNYSFTVGATIDVESYSNYTYETSLETFIANITLLSGTNFYDAQIDYNGTLYEGTITDLGGNNYSIKATLDIPLINPTTLLYDWHWKLTYEKPDETFAFQNLSTHQQNVSQISLFTSNSECIAGDNLTLNFSAYYEENLSTISSFIFDATFEYWLGSGNIRKNVSVSNSTVTDNMLYCIFPNNVTYYSDAKIQYEKAGFIKRSYYLINASITNTTNDIGLYLLNSSISTSFIVNIIDEVQFPVVNAYIYIQRYYPGFGTFHTVEMGRTDDSGNTIGHFEAETEDYKIIVFGDRVILYESEMHKVFCGETPCTLRFQIQAAAPTTWSDIGDLANLIWSLTYNEITKFWTYTYVDTSGTTNFGRLLVYIEDGANRNIICNKTDTSSAATLTCNCSGYDGTIYAEVYIQRSPEILVWLESIVERGVKAIFGMEGLFWATMIILLIGLIGVWNPSIGIIMMIAGIILINFLQIASLGTVTIMGITIIGAILLWEMKKP